MEAIDWLLQNLDSLTPEELFEVGQTLWGKSDYQFPVASPKVIKSEIRGVLLDLLSQQQSL